MFQQGKLPEIFSHKVAHKKKNFILLSQVKSEVGKKDRRKRWQTHVELV
jgi:hypothetical protein